MLDEILYLVAEVSFILHLPFFYFACLPWSSEEIHIFCSKVIVATSLKEQQTCLESWVHLRTNWRIFQNASRLCITLWIEPSIISIELISDAQKLLLHLQENNLIDKWMFFNYFCRIRYTTYCYRKFWYNHTWHAIWHSLRCIMSPDTHVKCDKIEFI